MKMAEISMGDEIKSKITKEAYYSNYGGRPKQHMSKGQRGTIGSIDVPPVTGRGGNYCCVDFMGTDGKVWRVALRPSDMERGQV